MYRSGRRMYMGEGREEKGRGHAYTPSDLYKRPTMQCCHARTPYRCNNRVWYGMAPPPPMCYKVCMYYVGSMWSLHDLPTYLPIPYLYLTHAHSCMGGGSLSGHCLLLLLLADG